MVSLTIHLKLEFHANVDKVVVFKTNLEAYHICFLSLPAKHQTPKEIEVIEHVTKGPLKLDV